MKKIILPAILASLATFTIIHAQTSGNEQPPEQTPPGHPGGRPPKNPVMEALDQNHDHVIDEQEIARAAESLLALDKNGDGRLTNDEIQPPRPPHTGGPNGEGDQPMGQPRQGNRQEPPAHPQQ